MKKIIPLLLVLGLVLNSCGKKGDQAGMPERLFPVVVAEVEKKDVPLYIESIGNVYASTTVDIKPQVSGKLVNVSILGGDDIAEGDILYQIDPIPFQLALDREEANLRSDLAELDYAKKKVERYNALSGSDYVSRLNIEEFQKDLHSLEGRIAVDKANVETAKTNLNYCTICSPINGRVNLETVDSGNIVSPSDQTPLATVLQISPIDVYFSLAQKDFENLQHLIAVGKNKFTVILPGTGQEFEGNVKAFDNQVDLKTGTIQVKGSIPNQDKILWPGEFVKVKVFIKTLKDAALIPASAVQMGQKGAYVYVLKDDKTVDNVPVKLGEHLDEYVVIEEGLKPGMFVITDGQLNLSPGAKVLVKNETKTEANGTP